MHKNPPTQNTMYNFESSIVIPVYNKWELTRKCLKSIARTTDMTKTEVIIVDNASSDVTPQAAPILGAQLFGDSFRYIRNETNRNFAGASNQGADIARGEFLIFLNNDTEVQEDWYRRLLDDFTTYPDIAATGPLLVYPDETPLGRTVQHLGVFISPSFNLGHLYAGIPATAPLARKRRFFQAITGACLVMRRSLFLEIGRFDEGYINGFEDVDLCARLTHKGYRMTVNPDALVIHHESQTPGRHAHGSHNAKYLVEKSLHLIGPDWHLQTRNDGLFLGVNEWLMYQPMMPEHAVRRLAALARRVDLGGMLELLVAHPFWKEGWERALELAGNPEEKGALLKLYFRLFRTPRNAVAAYALGKQLDDPDLREQGARFMRAYADTPEAFLEQARSAAAWCRKLGLEELAERHLAWAAQYENFKALEYTPFAKDFVAFAEDTQFPMSPENDRTYAVWTFGNRLQEPAASGRAGPAAAFSLLMPVYNPQPAHFRAALDSVLAQTYPHWELCVADDASTDPETTEILRQYMARDSRIRAVFRNRNGRIAAATNSALELATRPWSVLMDQDDLLTADALAIMAGAIAAAPDGMLFYSDEDKTDDTGRLFGPHFKNDTWDWELLPAQNFVCHLAAYRTERLRDVGGFRPDFEGAQDHDLLLRYVTGLDGRKLIHIPRVLYHWRSHEGSTAMDIGAKGYAFANARKAAQQWLDRTCPGAVAEAAPVRQWVRVRYPLPGERPRASILCRIPGRSFDLAAHAKALRQKTDYPHELVYTCAPEDREYWAAKLSALSGTDAGAQIRVMGAGDAEALNAAALAATGPIVGVVSPHLVDTSPRWLEEIVACLWRPGVGAVGGKSVFLENLALAHAGYMVDASGGLNPLFGMSHAQEVKYFGWNVLPRTVNALDGRFLFTRAADFRNAGGLKGALGEWAPQDYCLRLGQQGLRCVWWPFACFLLSSGQGEATPAARKPFAEKWDGRLPAFNKNLRITANGFALCTA